MSVYENTINRPVPLGSVGIFSVVSGVERIAAQLVEWNQRRLTRATLRRLTDAQLADIGLSRFDVADY